MGFAVAGRGILTLRNAAIHHVIHSHDSQNSIAGTTQFIRRFDTISQNVFCSIAHGSNYGGDCHVAASMYVLSHMEDEHAVLAQNAMKADN
jgi:hypothetical protein